MDVCDLMAGRVRGRRRVTGLPQARECRILWRPGTFGTRVGH
jgi:hypothetical protein